MSLSGSAKALVKSGVEASLCSYERVFGFVTATDYGQTTDRMCEILWVRCNEEAPEE